MYLMGRSDDTASEGMYPLVVVSKIEKSDLLRAKNEQDLTLINLDDLTRFNPELNVWESLGQFDSFDKQWE